MRTILFALLFVSLPADATSSHHDSDYESVCPSATVNYITQTLPQQCLRTDWSRAGGTQESVPTHASPSENTASAAGEAADDEDGDPLADQGNFLSFEEWKARMLEKAGQSPDHVVGATGRSPGSGENRRRATAMNNALDSLGDEGEIELDFTGFVNPDTAPKPAPGIQPEAEQAADEAADESPAPPVKRSKEAGTTSKERFNYASFDCAATVLKTNQGSKGATRILSENKDSYLINKCSDDDKYFIVELCNDILIDTVVLGNFEFFSSTFRTFRVSISDRYPVKADKWREIGTFEARNTRGVQAFMVEDGLIWARYLRVDLLAHYGKEYYCPVSLLRVHGTTMMDDYRNEMKDPHEQDDDEDESGLIMGGDRIAALAEVIPIAPIKSTAVLVTKTLEPTASTSIASNAPTSSSVSEMVTSEHLDSQREAIAQTSTSAVPSESAHQTYDSGKLTENGSHPSIHNISATTPLPTVPPTLSHLDESTQSVDFGTSLTFASAVDSHELLSNPSDATMTAPLSQMVATNISDNSASIMSSSDTASSPVNVRVEGTDSRTSSVSDPAQSSTPEASPSAAPAKESIIAQNHTSSQVLVKAQNTTTGGTKTRSRQSSPIKASPATPSTQDSFFRSVHKRLQMLEANSTLSLQYIEEQSRILRDAFGKAEKKQMQKTSKFLETLNSTVLGELRNIRIQYDQLWQSTVLELANQKEQSRREVRALGERFGLLADQMVWMKRVVYLQFFLIILCLGLVIFSINGVAGGSGVPLEPDLLRSIQHLRRGVSGMSFSKPYAGYIDSDPGTPSRPTSMGGMYVRKAGHGGNLSDGITSGDDVATNGASSPEQHRNKRLHVRMSSDVTTLTSGRRSKSPSVRFGADTPSSEHDEVADDTSCAEGEVDVPEADPMALKRAASSPPLGRQFDIPMDEEISSGAGDSEAQERVSSEALNAA